MNIKLRLLEQDIRSDPRLDKQTSEVVVEIVQYEPDTLGFGFDEFVLNLADDGTWYTTTRLGV